MTQIPDPGTRLRRMKILAPVVLEASAKSGENKERLMALCYRESWCMFAPGYSPKGSFVGWGDNDNAFGPFQLDKRYHGGFISAELWTYRRANERGDTYYPIGQAIYACGLLHAAREWFRRSASSVSGDPLERAVYASYNAGEHATYSALMNGKDVDAATTGRDYSAYIFSLASALQKPAYQWIWN